MISLQQLQRMMEAHALGPHHPQDYVAAFAASALATPHIFRRIDVQAGASVVVERAQADQFLAAANQLDSPRLGQPLDGHFPLDPLLHLRGNIGHRRPSFAEKPVKRVRAFLLHPLSVRHYRA